MIHSDSGFRKVDFADPNSNYLRKTPKYDGEDKKKLVGYTLDPIDLGAASLSSIYDILAYVLQCIVIVPDQPTKDNFFQPLLDLLARWVYQFRGDWIKDPTVCPVTWLGSIFFLGCSLSGYRDGRFDKTRTTVERSLETRVRRHRTSLLDMDEIEAECEGKAESLMDRGESKGQWWGWCAETIPFLQARAHCPEGTKEWKEMAIILVEEKNPVTGVVTDYFESISPCKRCK